MDRGAWRATVHRAAKSQTWLSTRNCFITCVTFCCKTWTSHMDTCIPFLLSRPPNPQTHPARPSQHPLWTKGSWVYTFPSSLGGESSKRGRRGHESLRLRAHLCLSCHTSNCIFPTWFQASSTLIFSFISNCCVYYNSLTQLRYAPYGEKRHWSLSRHVQSLRCRL